MTNALTPRLRFMIPLLAVLALAAAACGDGDTGADGDGDGTAGDGDRTVSMMGALVGDDEENLLASLEPWAADNGITIEYEGSGDFETLIFTRVQGGNPPDIALFPQPGLMADLHRDSGLRDLGEVLDMGQVESTLVPGLIDTGSVDEDFVGLMYRLNLKSLVWYPTPEFGDAGYEVPETWDELLALTDQIREDGTTPWCIGIESSGATGWVVTDWFEDLMLRTAGPEAYDAWIEGELAFDSDELTRVGEMFAEIALTEGNVLGGRQGIVTTPFGDAPNPMFEDPPACYLHRQAQFIEGFFPEEVTSDDFDFFYLPPVDEEHGSPVLIAGDLASLLTDNPAAEELINFMATPESGEAWAEAGAFLSPHTTFDASVYGSDVARKQQEILDAATAARFDASDMMPASVGAGSFWSEMTAWVNGENDLQTALQNIEASFPES